MLFQAGGACCDTGTWHTEIERSTGASAAGAVLRSVGGLEVFTTHLLADSASFPAAGGPWQREEMARPEMRTRSWQRLHVHFKMMALAALA